MVGSNLEVEIGSKSEVLAGTEVAEETVVVLQLSVLLALEGIQEEERQSFVCVLSDGKYFPVGRKNFSCRKEKFFLKFDQKVLNFRKFEWFTDGQLEEFFLSEGKIFPFVRKIFSSCRENIFLSDGRTRNARRI